MCFPASSWAASTKAAVKRRTVLLLLGTLCLLAALGLTIWNLWTADRAQAAAAAAVQQLEPLIPAPAQQEPAKTTDAPAAEPEEPDIPDYLLNPGMAMPVVMVDGVAYIGVLEIPALELTLPVTGEWSYDRLKIALCRYAGSDANSTSSSCRFAFSQNAIIIRRFSKTSAICAPATRFASRMRTETSFPTRSRILNSCAPHRSKT